MWVEREFQRIADTPGPVIAGPWTSEVGFELLYDFRCCAARLSGTPAWRSG